MIPKKIHYCWFGNNEKSSFIKSCIESWKVLGYEIYEWNEKNYDFNKHPYLKKNYKIKNWAFVSDYARLDILYNYGGFYFDTDVKIINKFEREFLDTDFLISFQFDCLLGTHFIGAKKNSKIIKSFLDIYDVYSENMIPNNNLFNDYFIKNIENFKLNGKNQLLFHLNEKINIYAKEYFSCPFYGKKGYAFHLLNNSWRKEKKDSKLKYIVKNIIGDKIYYNLVARKNIKISPYRERYLLDRNK